MECNCNNNNNGGVIPWVRGNRLPLVINVYELVLEQEHVGDSTLMANNVTRVPLEIQDGDDVTVVFKSGFRSVEMPFTTEDNKVLVTDNGELPTGIYTVEVTIEREGGSRGRWQETRQVHIYENNSEAHLDSMFALEADLFVYAKGTKGDKGDKGDDGNPGSQGAQGPKGDTVTATDYTLYNVQGSDSQGAMSQDATTKAISAQTGYYTCGTISGTAEKVVTVESGNVYKRTLGGHFKVQMTNKNTAASGVTLQIGSETAAALWYNGAAVSDDNSWDAGEVISVYFDGSNYQASNAQGGGGNAEKIKYDNVQSGLAATNVQDAIDDIINDLATIRSGAALGATAVQVESDPTVPAWAKESQKPSYSYSEITGKPTLSTVATSGSYNDLSNKPNIPTVPSNVSAFTNDAGYLTEHQDISGKANSNDLATVAFSGDYEDLTNTPTIPNVPEWAMSSTKPSYTVSEIDGAQEELVSGTNIKTINNQSLLGSGNITIQGGGGGDVNVIESITFNGSAVPVDSSKNAAITYSAPVISVNGNTGAVTISVPTKVSDLTNDSGFITSYTETDPVFNASAAASITSADITAWNGKSTFSGSYNDLTDKPTLFSGDYNDLSNKPTIPTVPTNVSAFNNDAGYLTQHQDISGKADKSEMSVTDGTGAGADKTTITLKSGTSATVLKSHQDISGKQDALVSGTNIKTINNESVLGSGNISVAAELPSNLAYTSNDNGEGIIPSDGIRAVTVTSAATMTISPDVVTVIDGAVGTAAITLQVPQDNLAHVWDILLTTDSTVAITFAMSNSATILTPSGFSIGASKAVEVSVIGVGTKYYLRYGEFA